MKAMEAEDVRRHVRIYLIVFAALAVLTVVTVAASYLDHSVPMAIALALVIASVKAMLVACFFMHLISERAAIYGILALTTVFMIVMLLVPAMTGTDMVVSELVS